MNVTTSTPGQSIKLTFSGTAGEQIALNTAFAPGTFGTGWEFGDVLRITGPDGQIFSANLWSFSNNTGIFSGPLTLPASGVYTVTFVPVYGETGPIAFTLYYVPPAASASIAANGSVNTLTTTAPGQGFSLVFSGAAGQTISLDVTVVAGTLGTNLGDIVTITGPTGQVYSGSMAWYSNSSELFSGVITLPAGGTGTYTITDTPSGFESGSLNFTLYTVPPPANTALTIGNSYDVATVAPGQTFAPTFTGSAGERISVDMQVISGTLGQNRGDVVTITGPTGQIYSGVMAWFSNSTELFTGVMTLPSGGSGVYTISDVPNWTGFGQLQFTVTDVPPDPTFTLTAGGPAAALSTTTPGQRMVLIFSGNAGDTISLLAQDITGNILADDGADLTIVDPDGVTQLYSGWLCWCSSSIITNALVLPTTGTYIAYLVPRYLETGGATFNLYNDAAAVGTLTPNGGSVGVTTTTPNQVMTLSMPETAGDRVAVLVQFDDVLDTECNGFSVTAPDGTTQLFNTGIACGASFYTGAMPVPSSVSATVPLLTQTGNYTVTLAPNNLAFGTATFTAYDIPPDVTGTVAIGAALSPFILTTPGQSLRATVAGEAGQNVTFAVSATLTNPLSLCTSITVLEPDGVSVLTGAQDCSGAYSTGSLTLPSAGNYLVVATPLVPATGTYSVGATSP